MTRTYLVWLQLQLLTKFNTYRALHFSCLGCIHGVVEVGKTNFGHSSDLILSQCTMNRAQQVLKHSLLEPSCILWYILIYLGTCKLFGSTPSDLTPNSGLITYLWSNPKPGTLIVIGLTEPHLFSEIGEMLPKSLQKCVVVINGLWTRTWSYEWVYLALNCNSPI